MKVLFLCGMYHNDNENEVIEVSKGSVDFAANIFQRKLLNGFRTVCSDVSVLSAPFIGSYPNRSKLMFFKGFSKQQDEIRYVEFCNIWGIRNFSRARALKKACKEYLDGDGEKILVVYSAHTPFLETAAYIKKRIPQVKICLVVPDLPQFMNLAARVSPLYKVAKSLDIKKMHRLMRCVDQYVLLTDPMKARLPVGQKSYFVVEGIVDREELEKRLPNKEVGVDQVKHIVYTGTLNERYGVKTLVEEFVKNTDQTLRLVICGRGDSETYIQQCAQKDNRIFFLGQVTPKVAREWTCKADVLVNPRPNDEEYTKYSFPSKNIEYLLSGNPVVCYKLDGMPEHYSRFVSFVYDRSELMTKIISAIDTNNGQDFFEYANQYLRNDRIAQRIIDMNG